MRNEKTFRGYVRLTLDKLSRIRANLVTLGDDWREWGFPQLVEALRKWCERNPVPLDSYTGGGLGGRGIDKALQTKHEPHGEREFYLPQKPIVRKVVESTKMQIVYDVSAKAEQTSPSLNDCLGLGLHSKTHSGVC